MSMKRKTFVKKKIDVQRKHFCGKNKHKKVDKTTEKNGVDQRQFLR